jgi:hypothetical protein
MDLFDALLAYDDQLAAWLRKLDASATLSEEQQKQRQQVVNERGDLRNAINTLLDTELEEEGANLETDATTLNGLTENLKKLKGTIDEAQKVITTIGQVAAMVAKLAVAVAPAE